MRPLTAESLTLQADRGYFPNGTLHAARDHWLAIGADVRTNRLSDRLGDPQPRRQTPREVELVGYVQSGLSNREIAERAHLSAKSVEGYLTRIYLKTGCHSRVELAVARREWTDPWHRAHQEARSAISTTMINGVSE